MTPTKQNMPNTQNMACERTRTKPFSLLLTTVLSRGDQRNCRIATFSKTARRNNNLLVAVVERQLERGRPDHRDHLANATDVRPL